MRPSGSTRGLERLQEVQNHSDADAGIRHVERGINVTAKVEIDEIDHMPVAQPVDEVADDAATQETEADLGQPLFQAQRPAPEENRHQRSGGENREQDAAAGEHAPGGTRVADVDEIEKSANHHDVVA